MKNKLRNLVLAVVCIGIFAAGGFFYYLQWVVQKPFGVVLFLVPEFTVSTVTAARLYGHSSRGALELENFGSLALLRNPANDAAVGDAAAAASAIATGHLVNVGRLAISPGGGELPTLAEMARSKGRAVGFITNGALSSPALAAFHAPGANPDDLEELVVSLVEKKRPEVLLGGGLDWLLPELKGGKRRDSRDLVLEARQGGYDIVRSLPELQSTPTWRPPRVLGIFANAELPSRERRAPGQDPSLADLVANAIQLLQFQRQGYFLVVDCSLLESAALSNNGERLLQEMLEVDQAVEVAKKFAGENSLIVVAGTVSHGGFQLNGPAMSGERGFGLLATSPAGAPGATWATGPGRAGEEEAAEPVAYRTEPALPVAVDVLCLVQPPEKALHGFHPSTAVFQLLADNL